MSVASVRRMERAERETSVAELVHIAEICGVPRSFMLDGFAPDDTRAPAPSDVVDELRKANEDLDRRLAVQEQFMARVRSSLLGDVD